MSSDINTVGTTKREIINLSGYHARVNPNSGNSYLASVDGSCFHYDFVIPPRVGGKLDPAKNPGLVSLALEMDKKRDKSASRAFVFTDEQQEDDRPDIPNLPEVYHGFGKNNLPKPTDTPAIRNRIIAKMAKSIGGKDGETITQELIAKTDQAALDKLIQNEWEDVIIRPGAGNTTTHYLINAQFYPYPGRALSTYEHFGHLLGAEIYNPVRTLHGLKRSVPNPARKVAKSLHIKLDRDPNTNDEKEMYTDEEATKLYKGMRERLGVWSHLISDDDIFLAIDNPSQPLYPSGLKSPVKKLGKEATVNILRELMPRYSDCVTDEDMLYAAENPNQNVIAAGLPRIQIMRCKGKPEKALSFTPTRLGVGNLYADYYSVKPWWRETKDANTTAAGT
jgi:hypothetical protein